MPINRIWRPFTELEIKPILNRAGVYELSDAKEEVVYIGSSENSVKGRLLEHKEKSRFRRVKYFRSMSVKWSDNPKDIEANLCASFRRKHNGKLPRLQERSPIKSTSLFPARLKI